MAQIPATHLILNSDKSQYHLNLLPQDLAENVVLVGDRDRVPFISALLDEIVVKKQNRGYVTHTGTYKGKRVTIMSTGIGTGNIDIVMNELDALVNIDLDIRQPKEKLTKLNIVRMGTSGAIHADIAPGEFVLSRFAMGLDNILDYYVLPQNFDEEQITENLKKQLPGGPYFYISEGEKVLINSFPKELKRGITCVAPGFYGPQNRQLRAQVKYTGLFEVLQNFKYQDLQVTNLEMEASAIYGLGKILGHRCCTIDVVVANRVHNTFLHDYHSKVLELGELVLETLLTFEPGKE
ncbi:MAG: nucleoside phosphorylase [Bacteroidia bacterium]